ncbi:unnamed protein product [Paramecium pentaurelia]|uniref:Uncharacterized protein n=1 Tax=Paramecium pentaurelia TaxID=43138 RepID=A0A8S1YF17_9CILI|nr:unnamed protein product [Paramecium pentaurelia]
MIILFSSKQYKQKYLRLAINLKVLKQNNIIKASLFLNHFTLIINQFSILTYFKVEYVKFNHILSVLQNQTNIQQNLILISLTQGIKKLTQMSFLFNQIQKLINQIRDFIDFILIKLN